MFQKKQIIYSEKLGACRVENIVQLAASKGDKPIEYYALKPLFGTQQAAYLPVQNHQQMLREIFSYSEARELVGTEVYKQDENLKKAVDYVLNAAQNDTK